MPLQLIDVKAYGGVDVRALVCMNQSMCFSLKDYLSETNSIHHLHIL